MDFVNEKAKSTDEKQFLCFLISNIVQDMDSLSFSEISNMLSIVDQGFQASLPVTE